MNDLEELNPKPKASEIPRMDEINSRISKGFNHLDEAISHISETFSPAITQSYPSNAEDKCQKEQESSCPLDLLLKATESKLHASADRLNELCSRSII